MTDTEPTAAQVPDVVDEPRIATEASTKDSKPSPAPSVGFDRQKYMREYMVRYRKRKKEERAKCG